jgi:hypothetical protein
MTSHAGRLYALALALVVFFLAWAVVAARPWAASTADPRLRALALRESALRREAALVERLVAQRDAAYRARARSAARALTAAAPAAPRVRVVTLPPLTVTRTS